jgi:hypothetical protein
MFTSPCFGEFVSLKYEQVCWASTFGFFECCAKRPCVVPSPSDVAVEVVMVDNESNIQLTP